MSQAVWNLNISDDKIATLTIDAPSEKVNVLSLSVLNELEEQLESLKNKQVKALVIQSGKKDSFLAGANLHEFESAFTDPSFAKKALETGHRVYDKLADLPFPTVAFIHGICVGGGLELALACQYRVATDHAKTSLGLPETTIGIFPGWGGSQRLPRLIGVAEGVQMITSGRPVNGQKALKIKLIDALLPAEFKEEKLAEFLKIVTTEKGQKNLIKQRERSGFIPLLIEGNPLGKKYLFSKARKEIQKKTNGHYPAPLIALDLIQNTDGLSLEKGLQKEVSTFLDKANILAPVAKNLIHLFFVQEALKKITGAKDGTPIKSVERIGIIGAGTMGAGIAYLTSKADYATRLKDVNWDILTKALGSINKIYQTLLKKKKFKKSEVSLKTNKISLTTDYSGFKNINFVIEAATENLDLKYQIFKELEDVIPKEAIIASNTSSLTIEEMSKKMQHPERFIGMHFFNPADRMPLVEVVPGSKTSPEVIVTTMDVCRKLGKTPVLVHDCHGFLVNRIFILGANEVIWMLQEGVPMERLEKVLTDFGLPMSPFKLSDEVGNDVSYKVSKIFEESYGSRMTPPDLLKKVYELKLLGKKTGKGFYIYKGKEETVNPEITDLIKLYPKTDREITDQEIVERVLYLMVAEGWRTLNEKVVDNDDAIDLAMIMGTGFPPFKGGLMQYAKEVGREKIIERLKVYEKIYGKRFAL